jgi:hypothetical protein
VNQNINNLAKEVTRMKILIFEGAGMDSAEHNGVGNARIRTKLTNKDGAVIYLEMTGHTANGLIHHCYVNDCNEHSEYRSLEGHRFDYTKESIIQLVNQRLNCDFEVLEVINDDSVNVHSSNEPLC